MKKKSMTRKCFVFSISLLLVLSNVLTPSNSASAATNKIILKEAPLNQSFVNDQIKVPSSKYSLGYNPAPFKLPSIKGSTSKQLASFPVAFDLRTTGKLTPIRDQSTSGACWAFASYASVESDLLKTENRDFSENNLKNTHGFDVGANNGGNLLMSTAYTARWSGTINEKDDPYNPTSTKSPTGLTVQKHVQDVLWIPDRTTYLDNSGIKDAVMKYGATYTSMYWKDSSYKSAYSSFYNSTSSSSNNHSVAIVGWDDNFDKNKFYDSSSGKIPAGNGAFIVRNSWGTSFGQAGYFYISYYDENVGHENGVFDAIESTSNYKTNYQYDPLGCVSAIGADSSTAWYSNVFTATSSEDLSAVAFYSLAPNTSYEVYVCSNYNSTSDLSSSRVLKASGTISIPGYHTIKLNTGALVTAGKKFAVIVKATTPNYTYPIPVEKMLSGYSSSATAAAGQSYVSDLGTSWSDLTSVYNSTANVCLKAFTNVATPYSKVTGVSLNQTNVSLMAGQTTNLIATVNPVSASNKNVTWTSSNTSVATVDSAGKVIAVGYGTATITVKTVDGGYTAGCTFSVDTTASIAVGNFVTRLYQQCLNRQPDSAGLNFWKNQLMSKASTGAGISNNFIFSQEFMAKNVSDDVFINIMYKSFFNRVADGGGNAYWMGRLNSGISRLYVLASFVNSVEFSNICNSYGIERGNIQLTKPADLYPDITAFVYRTYGRCLERKPDDAGLNYWVNRLATGQSRGSDFASSFVFSPEFIARNLSNNDFIRIMYRVFLNRDPDTAGMTYWVNNLNGGMTRLQAFNGFVNSQEFAAICNSYGIKV